LKLELWFEPNNDGHKARWQQVEATNPAEAIRESGVLDQRRPQDNIYCVDRAGKTFSCVPSNLRYGQTLKSLGYQQISL
jgi:hypothetical protein